MTHIAAHLCKSPDHHKHLSMMSNAEIAADQRKHSDYHEHLLTTKSASMTNLRKGWRYGPNYLGRVLRDYEGLSKTNKSAVLVDARSIMLKYLDDRETLIMTLWQELIDNVCRPHAKRLGGKSTMIETWLDLMAREHKYARNHKTDQLCRRAYYSHLGWLTDGWIAEADTIIALRNALPNHDVRQASPDDESKDIDCWIDDYPISIKNLRAYSLTHIRNYRSKKPLPVLYVNRDLDHILPHRNDRLIMRPASRLDETIANL